MAACKKFLKSPRIGSYCDISLKLVSASSAPIDEIERGHYPIKPENFQTFATTFYEFENTKQHFLNCKDIFQSKILLNYENAHLQTPKMDKNEDFVLMIISYPSQFLEFP